MIKLRAAALVFVPVALLVGNAQDRTLIAEQGFESGLDSWAIESGSEFVSSASGLSDTPHLQRIRSGSFSWQVQNETAALQLKPLPIGDFSDVLIIIHLSSTSSVSSNGADTADRVDVRTSFDGSPFAEEAGVTLRGRSNARWGYDAALDTTVNSNSGSVIQAPQGGTSSNNFSALRINVPDTVGSIAIRITAANNHTAEIWNVDDIYLEGVFVGAPLPVELIDFRVRLNSENVILQWTTMSETRNAGFQLYRSTINGFEAIAFVDGAGTSSLPRKYEHVTTAAGEGSEVFKLEQIDSDGARNGPWFAELPGGEAGSLVLSHVAPNPARSQFRFRMESSRREHVVVSLFDPLGRRIRTLFSAMVEAGENNVVLGDTSGLASGIYFLRCEHECRAPSRRVVVL